MRFRRNLRSSAIALIFGTCAASFAQVALSNGPFQTHVGGGPSGAPRSEVQVSTLNLNDYGFGCQKVNNHRLADDFVVPSSARLRLSGIAVKAYQTSATSNTINEVNFRIWNGAPNSGGTVVAGDPITNVFAAGTTTSVFRTDDLSGGATSNLRQIMSVQANLVSSTVLLPGTFWVDFQMAGSLASGPWAVPVTVLGQTGKVGANALQFSLGAWNPLADSSGPLQDVAFEVLGSWLMNPTSATVVEGTPFGGNVASLATSDNNRFIVLLDETGPNSNVEFTTTTPASTASRIDYSIELNASRSDLSQFVSFFNTSNQWESLDFSTSTISDTTRNIAILTNPGRFLLSGSLLKSRIVTIPQLDIESGDGWTAATDFVQWEVTP